MSFGNEREFIDFLQAKEKRTGVFSKVYYILLWFCGFIADETITDMLKRQKKRLGVYWWLLPGGTFAILIWLVFHIIGIV